MKKDLLEKAGVDYEAGLKHFMNDTSLYKAVLTAFVRQDVIERARQALADGDKRKLWEAVREAKGSAVNARIMTVSAEASVMIGVLSRESCSENELALAFSSFEKTYASAKKDIISALSD